VNNPLRTSEDYALFLYTLTEQFPSVRRSTVTFVRRGATLARVAGELSFDYGIRLVVRERVIFDRLPVMIDWYGYEVWQGEEKLYWRERRTCGSMVPGEAALRRGRSQRYCQELVPTSSSSTVLASSSTFWAITLTFLAYSMAFGTSGHTAS